MKSIRENAGVLILCIAELLVGILLLINPVGFTAGIVIAAGVLLIASGLQSVVRYWLASALRDYTNSRNF